MRLLVGLLLLTLPQVGWKGEEKIPLSPDAANAVVESLGVDYYRAKFAFYPAYASSKGIRDYDGRLASISPHRVERFLTRIRRVQGVLTSFDEDSLSVPAWIDFKALSSDISTQIFLLEELEVWRTSPVLYSDACINGIYSLLRRRDTSGLDQSLSSRLAGIPKVGLDARRNLTHPLKLHCEVASRSIKDFLPFLARLRGLALRKSLKIDSTLIDRARRTLEGLAAHFDSIAPTAEPDFSLGYENFTRLLEVQHMIRESPEDLLAYAEHVLAEAKAQKAESGKSQSQASVDTSQARLLETEDIIGCYYDEADSAMAFIRRRDLMTLPEDAAILVVQTPSFLRAAITAYAYEPPGPFDQDQTGLYYIPLQEEMDLEARLDYYGTINRRGFAGSVVHEAYPGHHLQIVFANRHPSFIRKLQEDSFTTEGWAFYCEELMAKEGYLGQQGMEGALAGIVFRAARVIVDIKMQLGEFSLDEAVDFMVNESGGSRDFIEKEVRRYAVEPAQAMSYLIGKRDILRLRDEFREVKGDSYTIKGFHDTLLSCGSVPLYLLRTCVMAKAMGRL